MTTSLIHSPDPKDPAVADALGYSQREIATLRLWLALVQAARRLEGRMNSRMLAEFGHGFTRFDAMSQLYRAPGGRLSIRQLRHQLLIQSDNISRLLDRMQHDRLIERVANPQDRRSLDVVLTPIGRAVFEKMAKAHAGWVDQALASLDQAALNRLTTDLHRID